MTSPGPAATPLRAEPHIQALAAGQHGVVTRRQLLEAGVSCGMIQRRLNDGRLRRLHSGVYQVGPVEAPRAREMAAALACGLHAAVSHRSAAALWELPVPARRGRVEVSGRPGTRCRRPGIRLYRPRALAADEVTTQDRIPVTTPARTLLDLAGVEEPKVVERALAEALVQRLTTPDRLSALADRYPRRPGVALLRGLLEAGGEAGLIRSQAEKLFSDLMDKAGLPKPAANMHVLGRRRDFVWSDQRLVVEVDGYRFHSSRRRFESDRSRDAELVAAGWRTARVTWSQMREEPEKVVARMAQALVWS